MKEPDENEVCPDCGEEECICFDDDAGIPIYEETNELENS